MKCVGGHSDARIEVEVDKWSSLQNSLLLTQLKIWVESSQFSDYQIANEWKAEETCQPFYINFDIKKYFNKL